MTFILESTLFILMGLQFPGVLEALDDESPVTLLVSATFVALAVILARLVFQLSAMRLEGIWATRRGVDHLRLSAPEELVVGWSGMRGAVSLAAALAVPLTIDSGAAFPHRDEMIFLTLTTIGATLILQGLTLPLLIRRLDVEDEAVGGLREQAQARFRSVEAALSRISELSYDPDTDRDAVERARDMYAARAQQLTAACRDGVPDTDGSDAALRRLRLDLLQVERSALIELRDTGRVKFGTFRQIEEDLDIEQQRLLRAAPVERPVPGPPAGVPD
jgi:CPA1 family monovalent cation:H+ antiporter